MKTDVSVSGSQYAAAGSPSLAHLIKSSALDVAHPTDPSKTVWDALYDFGPYTGEQDAEFASMWATMNQTRARAASEDDVRNIAPLGSGSDFTVFLQRLGVSHLFRIFWVILTWHDRSLALIRLLVLHPLILFTTTTPFMILSCGKKNMLTLVSIDM